jgi:streptogramin lyase
MTRHITRALAVTALAALAACSGGASALPTPAANALTPSGNGQATLSFTRLAPQTGAAAKTRRPNEFSFAANSLVVDATNPNASPYHAVFDISGAVITNGLNCSADVSGIYQTCSVQVLLPLGNDQVTVATNSARDGSGTTLGSATVPFTVVDNQANTLAMTLDGAVKSIKLFVSDPNPATGAAVNLPLTVQLYDATGTVLIAPQNYTSPVTIADPDTGPSTSLFTQASQNSTQRQTGTGVTTTPSAKTKSISVPDRYTQPFFSYDGTTAAAVTLTATFGTFTATVTITPSAQAARTAGANGHTFTLASPAPRAFDPIFDKNGNLWTTITGGIASLNATTRQITATYSVPAGRSFRSPVIGPDGAIWADSGTANNGTTGAPWYVTRFDPVTHAFTDYPTADEAIRLVTTPSGLWGAERNASKLWQLPFTGSTPAAAASANEYAVAGPPQADSTPLLASLPTRIFPSADGNLWVIEMSFATVNGAWIAKYSPAGTKLSEVRVNAAKPTAILDPQAIDSTGNIWFTDSTSQNEFERFDTATGTVTIFAVPRLYGSNARSLFTAFSTVDASDNFWFINSLDGRIGRIDHVTGRVDLLNGPNNNYNSMTISGTTFVLDGFTNAVGATPGTTFIFTMNT